MRSPKRSKSRKPASPRRGRGRTKRRSGGGIPKTHLLNPKVTRSSASGKVESITGTCTEPGCSNERTIKPQDAFQLRRCVECQRKAFRSRVASKRKAPSARAGKAGRDC